MQAAGPARFGPDGERRAVRRVFDGGTGGGSTGPQGPGGRLRAAFHEIVPPLHAWPAAFAENLDRERGRWCNWVPVLFGCGAAAYFSMSEEPTPVLVIVLAAIAVLSAWRYRVTGAPAPAVVALFAVGFLAGVLRTATVATPPLPFGQRVVTVTGWVEAIEDRDKGARRITLRPISVSDIPADRRPKRLRVVDRHNSPLAPGEAISLRARIYAPSGPVMPRGHDFARDAWFRGIGAVGYSLSPPVPVTSQTSPPLPIVAITVVESARTSLTATIRAIAPGPPGDLIAALVTGQRSTLAQDAVDAMRDAGLAHLLAISGLHMSLVAGALFQILRACLALSPGLALRFAIKKWSAGGALAGAVGYLVLSGAAVSTQRAFVMMAVMFTAVLFDRPAATMRNVAIAALIILAASPENVLHAGFQMSFATVVALVAFYEWASGLAFWRRSSAGLIQRLLRQAAAIGSTTVVAGVATAPIVAFHFHQLAAYSLAANIVAVPVVGLVVMPCALVGVLALPFGLADPFFALSAAGGDLVLAIAHHVASWKGSTVHVSSVEPALVAALVAGGLWLCLWSGRWRLIGIALMGASLLVPTTPFRPEVLIDRDGRNIAIRNRDGQLAVMSARRSVFAVEAWLAADGDGATVAEASARQGLACDPLGCFGRTESGLRIAYVRNAAVLVEECRLSDIVIAIFDIDPRRCRDPDLVIAGSGLKGTSHAIRMTPEGPVMVDGDTGRGRRPWTQKSTPAD